VGELKCAWKAGGIVSFLDERNNTGYNRQQSIFALNPETLLQ
jgi:hypothetical protein